MSFWNALKKANKAVGVPVVGPAIDLAEQGINARRLAKKNKRERRLAAMSALAGTFKNPIVLGVLALCFLAFLLFAPPEAKKSLMDFIKFFTG